MSATCVRCSGLVHAPAGPSLCADCRARLRTLLSARAGARRGPVATLLWSPGLLVGRAVALVAVVLHQATLTAELPEQSHGVWKVLGGASFVSPVGVAVNRQGELYIADAASHHI